MKHTIAIIFLIIAMLGMVVCWLNLLIAKYHIFGFYTTHKYMSQSKSNNVGLPIIKNASVKQIAHLLDPADLYRPDEYPDSLLASAKQLRHMQRMGIDLSNDNTSIHASTIIIEGTVYQLSRIEFYKWHFWYTKFLNTFPIVKYQVPWDELEGDMEELIDEWC